MLRCVIGVSSWFPFSGNPTEGVKSRTSNCPPTGAHSNGGSIFNTLRNRGWLLSAARGSISSASTKQPQESNREAVCGFGCIPERDRHVCGRREWDSSVRGQGSVRSGRDTFVCGGGGSVANQTVVAAPAFGHTALACVIRKRAPTAERIG